MNHARRDPTDPDVGTVEPTSTPLDFLAERDDRTDSWTRSDPADALIEPLNRYGWNVTQELPNDPARLDTTGEAVHVPTVDALEDDDEDEEIDASVPDEARADGGRPVIERPRDLRTEPRWTGR